MKKKILFALVPEKKFELISWMCSILLSNYIEGANCMEKRHHFRFLSCRQCMMCTNLCEREIARAFLVLHHYAGGGGEENLKLDPVGSTVAYEMMKLCTGSL